MQTTETVRHLDRSAPARRRAPLDWSPAEDAALRVEFRRGQSIDEIACRHGRPVHAIRTRLLALREPLVLTPH